MIVEVYFANELAHRGFTDDQIINILVEAQSQSPSGFKWHERLRAYPETLLEIIRTIINRIALKIK